MSQDYATKFCPDCGTQMLPMVMNFFCPQCEEQLKKDVEFNKEIDDAIAEWDADQITEEIKKPPFAEDDSDLNDTDDSDLIDEDPPDEDDEDNMDVGQGPFARGPLDAYIPYLHSYPGWLASRP